MNFFDLIHEASIHFQIQTTHNANAQNIEKINISTNKIVQPSARKSREKLKENSNFSRLKKDSHAFEMWKKSFDLNLNKSLKE